MSLPRPNTTQGAVLLTALIMLIALMVAAGALMRMVDSANLLAGNLGFKRAATLAAENGVEAAIDWLQQQSPAKLEDNNAQAGYYASAMPLDAAGNAPGKGVAAIDWNNNACAGLVNSACLTPKAIAGTDAAGHSVAYLIQRLCSAAGALSATGECARYLDSEAESSSRGAVDYSSPKRLTGQPWAYYRITARAVGPRNTVSLIQVLARW